MPPINGATAFSGTPYFTAAPGDQYSAWDMQLAFDYLPSQFVTFRGEYNHRHASVPYFTGPGWRDAAGRQSGRARIVVEGWSPDLRPSENRVTFALLVKF